MTRPTLRLKAEDELAELFVFDANLKMVARGIRTLEAPLERGLYKIKVRLGDASEERIIELVDDRSERFEQLSFRSPVPLARTATSHEYQMASVRAGLTMSRRPAVEPESPERGTLSVIVRVWRGPRDHALAAHVPPEACPLDLAVYAADSGGGSTRRPFPLEEGDQRGSDPLWLGRRPLPWGNHILAYSLGGRLWLHQPVYVARGWDTRVFLLLDRTWAKRIGPSVPGMRPPQMSVTMARGPFDPLDPAARSSEAMLHLLAHAHRYSPAQLSRFLDETALENDPMLALLTGYALQRAAAARGQASSIMGGDMGAIRPLLDVLNGPALERHPDALVLRREEAWGTDPDSFAAPMLADGYRQMLQWRWGPWALWRRLPRVAVLSVEQVFPFANDVWLTWRGCHPGSGQSLASKFRRGEEALPEVEQLVVQRLFTLLVPLGGAAEAADPKEEERLVRLARAASAELDRLEAQQGDITLQLAERLWMPGELIQRGVRLIRAIALLSRSLDEGIPARPTRRS